MSSVNKWLNAIENVIMSHSCVIVSRVKTGSGHYKFVLRKNSKSFTVIAAGSPSDAYRGIQNFEGNIKKAFLLNQKI